MVKYNEEGHCKDNERILAPIRQNDKQIADGLMLKSMKENFGMDINEENIEKFKEAFPDGKIQDRFVSSIRTESKGGGLVDYQYRHDAIQMLYIQSVGLDNFITACKGNSNKEPIEDMPFANTLIAMRQDRGEDLYNRCVQSGVDPTKFVNILEESGQTHMAEDVFNFAQAEARRDEAVFNGSETLNAEMDFVDNK